MNCLSDAEIDKAINNQDLSILIVNAYMDFTDYNDPVKHFIDDPVFFHLESTRHNKAEIYVM